MINKDCLWSLASQDIWESHLLNIWILRSFWSAWYALKSMLLQLLLVVTVDSILILVANTCTARHYRCKIWVPLEPAHDSPPPPFPMCSTSIILMTSLGPRMLGSYSTWALLVERATTALVTPATPIRVRSILCTHEEHVIPSTYTTVHTEQVDVYNSETTTIVK